MGFASCLHRRVRSIIRGKNPSPLAAIIGRAYLPFSLDTPEPVLARQHPGRYLR
jgi:hypothetical protein